MQQFVGTTFMGHNVEKAKEYSYAMFALVRTEAEDSMSWLYFYRGKRIEKQEWFYA
jgi:hypothetical protein